MIRIGQIKISLEMNKTQYDPGSEDRISTLRKKAAKVLRISEGQIEALEISKHSIDARKKPELFDVYTVDVTVKGIKGTKEEQLVKKCRDKNVSVVSGKKYDFTSKVCESIEIAINRKHGITDALGHENSLINLFPDKLSEKKVVIIGAGPAGLFCGYELAKAGFKPLILERGADVDKRLEVVEKFWETGKLDVRTNVQYGEGGAGTFSDGKLNTMVKDKEGRGAEALDIFVKHGAPERIKYESKPHIGTDILKDVVKNIRNSIIEAGGEVLFENQVTDFVLDENGKLKGVEVTVSSEKRVIECDAAVLAIGHSARDTFEQLYERNVDMQTKPFAVGFRVEHPQSLIDKSQYGIADSNILPAAPYKLTTTTKEGRGVYSFCMCPGGYVVNASSESGRLAVNGMSYSGRDGKNANSAIIITVDPKDFGSDHVLSGVEFQRNLEKKAYELANGNIPVEYYRDFKDAVCTDHAQTVNEDEKDVIEWTTPQMKGNYEFANVHDILPDDLNQAFVEGMENFGRTIKGYNDPRALVSGVESRTSSPVRIVRGESGESTNVSGLFPCGEGAGYAGGIMSAAMDGIRTAEFIAKKFCYNRE